MQSIQILYHWGLRQEEKHYLDRHELKFYFASFGSLPEYTKA